MLPGLLNSSTQQTGWYLRYARCFFIAGISLNACFAIPRFFKILGLHFYVEFSLIPELVEIPTIGRGGTMLFFLWILTATGVGSAFQQPPRQTRKAELVLNNYEDEVRQTMSAPPSGVEFLSRLARSAPISPQVCGFYSNGESGKLFSSASLSW